MVTKPFGKEDTVRSSGNRVHFTLNNKVKGRVTFVLIIPCRRRNVCIRKASTLNIFKGSFDNSESNPGCVRTGNTRCRQNSAVYIPI